MKNISIATSEDVEGINHIRRTVTNDDKDNHNLNDLAESDIVEKEYQVTFVAFKNECIVGYLKLDDFYEDGKSNIAAMMQMFILPEFRNQGLGSRLIDNAIKYCDKIKKFKRIILTVLRINPAHELYKRIGFQDYKDEDDGFWMFREVGEYMKIC